MGKGKYHVRMANTKNGGYLVLCLNCSVNMVPKLPMPMDEFSAVCESFDAEHKDCEPGPRTLTIEEAAERFSFRGEGNG